MNLAISPLFHNIFDIFLTSRVQLHINLLNMVVRIIFSSILKIWYVDERISRSVSESPLKFEKTRVDCNYLSLEPYQDDEWGMLLVMRFLNPKFLCCWSLHGFISVAFLQVCSFFFYCVFLCHKMSFNLYVGHAMWKCIFGICSRSLIRVFAVRLQNYFRQYRMLRWHFTHAWNESEYVHLRMLRHIFA